MSILLIPTIMIIRHLAVMLTFLFSSGSMLSQATNSNFVMYDNPNFGIKIQYPADWAREETDDEFGKGVIFLVPGSPIKYAEKLSIDILVLQCFEVII